MTCISIQSDGLWGLMRYQQNANCEPDKLAGSYLVDLLLAEDMFKIKPHEIRKCP